MTILSNMSSMWGMTTKDPKIKLFRQAMHQKSLRITMDNNEVLLPEYTWCVSPTMMTEGAQ